MRRGAVAFGATLIVCAVGALGAAAKPTAGPAISLSASPAQITSGQNGAPYEWLDRSLNVSQWRAAHAKEVVPWRWAR